MKLGILMEDYCRTARETTVPSMRPPIEPTEGQGKPIVPMDRWQLVDKKRLLKVFRFKTLAQRNQFVFNLLQFEELTQHSATMTIDDDSVAFTVWTKEAGCVTDLDKDYAKAADVIYKDVCYVPVNEF